MHTFTPAWYLATQGILCTFSALVFLSLWPKGRPSVLGDTTAVLRRDPALLWLALAQAVWGVIAFLLLWPPAQGLPAMRPIASTLNNMFLLMATVYFEHAPRIVSLPRYHRSWRIGVLVAGAIVLAATVAGEYGGLGINAPDVVLSLITLAVLGVGLFRAFWRRGFWPLALLSCGAVALAVILQALDIPFARRAMESTGPLAGMSEEGRYVCLLVEKALLIVLFFGLATTWIYEALASTLAARPAPAPPRETAAEPAPARARATAPSRVPVGAPAPGVGLVLECTDERGARGKRKVVIHDPARGVREAFVSEMVLVHLLWFYARRRAEPTAGWLRVKRRSDAAATGWTMDHTQRRLIHEGLELDGEQLFEKHPGKPGQYRLAVDPANVRLTPALLEALGQEIAATAHDAEFLRMVTPSADGNDGRPGRAASLHPRARVASPPRTPQKVV